jgi:hypothetical protein
MRLGLCLALVFAMLQLAVLGADQSPTLTGTWAVEAAAAESQTADGGTFSLTALSGTLTLEQKGEAVTGSWKGRLPEPWPLTGRVQETTFELQTEVREMPASRNGEKMTIRRSWIFRGSIEGDKVSGSMSLMGGEGDPPTQPFSAVRNR